MAQEWLERWRDNPEGALKKLRALCDSHERSLAPTRPRRRSPADKIRVVDLTQTLSPEFPHISLPPEMGQAWPFRIEEVSRYDERGPAWYWNNFSCGEHTGTHFDAPVHWVSGKDLPNNATDSIPPERFIGPACVHRLLQGIRGGRRFSADAGTAPGAGKSSTAGFRRGPGC